MRGKRRQAIVLSSDEESPHECIPVGVKNKQKRIKKQKDSAPTCQPLQVTQGIKAYFSKGKKEEVSIRNKTVTSSGQLWVDKYAPRCEFDLAVHKKKIQEVREWLESQIQPPEQIQTRGSRVLVLTGPPGAGKTAVLQVLATELNCNVLEWQAPVPTLWREHTHQNTTDISYLSKLQEFEDFLDTTARFPALSLSSSPSTNHPSASCQLASDMDINPSQTSIPPKTSATKLLVVEDLPLASDKDSQSKLQTALKRLAASARFPTVVIVSDSTQQDHGRVSQGRSHVATCLASLEEGGAKQIAFNPVAPSLVKKAVQRVLHAEGRRIPPPILDSLLDGSKGDIRNALHELQFLCIGKLGNGNAEPLNPVWDPGGENIWPINQTQTKIGNQEGAGGGGKRSRAAAQTVVNVAAAAGAVGESSAVGGSIAVGGGSRDTVITLFHALGKVLYNKRLPAIAEESKGTLTVDDALKRPPLDMEDAEIVLAQASADVGTTCAFLHENLPQFLTDDGMDDLARSDSYLSDADCLRSTRGRVGMGSTGGDASTAADYLDTDSTRIAAAAAGSVLVRGLLFANTHPAARRFHALRAPALWNVEKEMRIRKDCLFMGVTSTSESGLMTASCYATDVEPFRRQIMAPQPETHAAGSMGGRSIGLGDGGRTDALSRNGQFVDGAESDKDEVSEDEIEDW